MIRVTACGFVMTSKNLTGDLGSFGLENHGGFEATGLRSHKGIGNTYSRGEEEGGRGKFHVEQRQVSDEKMGSSLRIKNEACGSAA